MSALILFCAIGHNSAVEYDHGYFPGRVTGMKEPLPYVPLVHRFTVAGCYKTFEGKSALILDRGGKGTYEIVTLEWFRKNAKVLKYKSRTEPLYEFNDSDLSMTIQKP